MVSVDKDHEVHGEPAIFVEASLWNGQRVMGTFTKDQKASFGGVAFETKKDVVGLMSAKIKAVINGEAEL